MNVNEYGKMTSEKVTEQRTLEEAIRKYGEEAQTKMLLKKAAELYKEIRKPCEEKGKIAADIADVEIMLEQVKISFGIMEIVASERRMKVNCLAERMKGGI